MALLTIITARNTKTVRTAELSKEARRAVRERLDRNPLVRLYEVESVTGTERRTWGDLQGHWKNR